jgi:hypothetical protein
MSVKSQHRRVAIDQQTGEPIAIQRTDFGAVPKVRGCLAYGSRHVRLADEMPWANE